MTILAFWPVDSYEIERHTLDNVSDLEAFSTLWKQKDELDVRFFDMTNRKRGDFYYMGTPEDFEQDYNDEVFDLGWWCKVLNINEEDVKQIISD